MLRESEEIRNRIPLGYFNFNVRKNYIYCFDRHSWIPGYKKDMDTNTYWDYDKKSSERGRKCPRCPRAKLLIVPRICSDILLHKYKCSECGNITSARGISHIDIRRVWTQP